MSRVDDLRERAETARKTQAKEQIKDVPRRIWGKLTEKKAHAEALKGEFSVKLDRFSTKHECQAAIAYVKLLNKNPHRPYNVMIKQPDCTAFAYWGDV